MKYILKWNFSTLENNKNYTQEKEFINMTTLKVFLDASEGSYKIYNYEIVEKEDDLLELNNNDDNIEDINVVEERKTKVCFNKSGGTAKGNAITNRVTIPTSWIKQMGITLEDREVKLIFKDNKILIEKNSK